MFRIVRCSLLSLIFYLHPHFLPACRRQYRNCDESAFSRKILPNLVGMRQQEETKGPFIFEKTTTMVTFECGLKKDEEGSHHLQWESLDSPELCLLLSLCSLLCKLLVIYKTGRKERTFRGPKVVLSQHT